MSIAALQAEQPRIDKLLLKVNGEHNYKEMF